MMDRMEHARLLARKCFEFADPDFTDRYIGHAKELLSLKAEVTGDEFKDYCTSKGLRLPPGEHHNVWPSCVTALKKMGLIEFSRKVVPVKGHNHMESVCLWRSTIYDKTQTTDLEELLA